jgi:uroporphyrinogen decarboxylase
MNKFYETLNGSKSENPIWIMRQAGRYLPEYMQLRNKSSSFLDLCYDPLIASEITLQPIKRFGFDAAIIFSDILLVLDALNVDLKFVKNEGPKLKYNPKLKISEQLNFDNYKNHLEPVYKAISLTRDSLDEERSLIGFAGGFWTLFAYLIEGSSSKDFAKAKEFALNEKSEFLKIKDILIKAIAEHLMQQVRYGANVIKIFDSWAGILDAQQFANYCIAPTEEIVNIIKREMPEVKIIGFPRGARNFLPGYLESTGVDVVALDYNVTASEMRRLYHEYGKVVQGNLDPTYLLAKDKNIIKEKTLDILETCRDVPHIFNLGHGILPQTPIENVEYLVDLVRNY